MDNLTNNIIEQLNQGKSYREIQKILNVSPVKISQVKKEFMNLLSDRGNPEPCSSSSNSAIATATGSATAIFPNMKISDFMPEKSSTGKNSQSSAIDPDTLRELKIIQTEHEYKMKKLEFEEKERERKFQRENEEFRHRSKKEDEGKDIEIRNLRNEILSLRDQYNRLKEQLISASHENTDDPDLDEYSEIADEEEDDDPEYFDDIKVFVKELLKKDSKPLVTEKIKEMQQEITDLKERFENICDSDNTKVEGFDDWEVLTKIESGIKLVLDNIKKNRITGKTRIDLTDKTKKLLTGFLEK